MKLKIMPIVLATGTECVAYRNLRRLLVMFGSDRKDACSYVFFLN